MLQWAVGMYENAYSGSELARTKVAPWLNPNLSGCACALKMPGLRFSNSAAATRGSGPSRLPNTATDADREQEVR